MVRNIDAHCQIKAFSKQIQSMLDKRTSDKRTHRISEPFFISQYQFPNFLHCKTNKHRISEPRISEPHRINEPFFISQRYPNSYLSERFQKKNCKDLNTCNFSLPLSLNIQQNFSFVLDMYFF